ncbi:TolC family protein [Roseovarius sp. MMSF_3281]|uniref:TolC family protein n=1 Tax=Roseovarius sp. MMSF_3281 TaxID=3046694 RepID=UPI00273E4759|nr:TolC family protein [Roseovarius sp. MMSF_3281]
MRPHTAPAVLSLLLVGLTACAEPPDLEPVTESLETGTAGLGAQRVKSDVAKKPFGKFIARAVTTDPAMRRSLSDIRAARAEKQSADGAFLPDLSVGVSAETRYVNSSTTSDASPFVRVSQLVYDAGAARADQTAAEARVLQSRARQIESGAGSTLSAVEAYKRLITNRRLLALAQENLRVLRGIANQIDERAQRGAGSSADNLTARSRVADAETRRVDAQAGLERAQAAFRRYFAEIPKNLPTPVKAPALPANQDDVLIQSPRLRAASASLKAAEADLIAAQSRRQPAVEVGWTGRQAPSGGGADVGLDLTLNYSLDTRGQRRAAIDAAQARLDAAKAERDTLLRDVREALAFVRTDQAAGEARVAAAREAVQTNAASVQAARDQFSIGRRSLIDLLDAQRDYVRAEETLIRAEQERFLTDYAALALTGDILDVFEITLPKVPE